MTNDRDKGDGGSAVSVPAEQDAARREVDDIAAPARADATVQPEDQGIVDRARQQVTTLVSEAKEQTSEVAGQAKQHVSALMTERKDQAATRLADFAGVLREAAQKVGTDDLGGHVGRYARQAADQMESMSHYVRRTDVQTFLRDTSQIARRRPELFLGGTFVTGLLAGRFLKASTASAPPPQRPVGGG